MSNEPRARPLWYENLRYGGASLALLVWVLWGGTRFAYTRPPEPSIDVLLRATIVLFLPLAIGVVVSLRWVRRGGALSRVACGVFLGVTILVVGVFALAWVAPWP